MGDTTPLGDLESSIDGRNERMGVEEAPKLVLESDEQAILDKQSHINEAKASFLGLYRHATWGDLVLVVISTVAALAAGALYPTAPIVNAKLVQLFSRAKDEGTALTPVVNRFTLYYVYFFIISLVCWTVATAGFIHTASRITRRIKTEYFAAVLRQNMAIFDAVGTGDILSHLTADTNMIQEALSSKLAISIAAMGNLTATLVVCFVLDWILTFILSWSFILGGTVLILSGKATVRYGGRSLDASSAGTSIVEEALSSIKSTTALGLQKHIHSLYTGYLHKSSKEGFVLKTLNSSMISLCVASGYINVALGFWQGSRRLTDGITPFTHVVAITLVLKSAAFCVLNVGSNLETFNMAVAAAGRIYRMTNRVSPIDPASDGGFVRGSVEGTVELRNVRHVYPCRQTAVVLDDVSIAFPAKKTTAIVGPSGSGKSSIASLILRFYEPVAGDIFLDGCSLSSLNLQWLRQQVQFVSQEPFLFNMTVYENIEYGLTGPRWDGIPEEEKRKLVYKAAEVAQASDFIAKLPQGYDTVVGARGSRLSGGQVQRVAIARALVSEPRILVLDEATSALDNETEAKVLAAMNESYRDCTRIVIAHRLSTIINADKIVVLKTGHVAEEGTHSELMAAEAVYSDLVRAQDMSHEETAELEIDVKNGLETNVQALPGSLEGQSHQDDIGDAISISEEVEPENKSSSIWSLVKFGWRLNNPEMVWIIIGLVCSIVAGFEEPGSAILFSKAIVAISQPLSMVDEIRSETAFYSWMFFLLGMVMLLVLGVEGVIFAWCSEKMTNRARSMALEKILTMEVAFFDKKRNSAGALASFLSTSTNDLAGVSGSALSVILICLSTAVSGIAVGMAYGWKLALVCLSLFPLLVCSGYYGVWLVGEFEKHIDLYNNRAAEFASEALSGIRTIAAMTKEDKALDQFRRTLDATAGRALWANLQTSFFYAMAQAIYYAGMALSFWYGSRLLMRHEYTLGQFIVVQASMLMSAYSAGLVFSWTPSIGKAKRASATLQHLLRQKSSIDPSDALAGVDPGTPAGQIDFESVTFFYPSRPAHAALKNLSFSVEAGSNVAFVGPTGSGKSTIISMIERFYDPSSGTIRLDGQGVESLQVAKYRQHIGLVNQDPTLYSGTIETNLLAGLNDEGSGSLQAAMEEACKQANIYDFIQSLPDGFQTNVGNRGTQLSVGQKQRIALARALIRRPTILLLDEATSALDSQSEMIIRDALEKAKKGRTTITIAHRLSTITKAERIYVLDQGSIVEAGTHAELMAKRERYYALYIASSTGQTI
ncbi:Leptomycin B resistance protein pmd1 [Escovopsis weberi]|uniref:Leptomycin B resistance protein pmd1 n=1 Tax=Escovopsis weberi TaxID=150374 RepID=A0A0M8N4J0_ESCWE|nr:Leptomycin B resistance protein pmd1 [Escovopsis weberi]